MHWNPTFLVSALFIIIIIIIIIATLLETLIFVEDEEFKNFNYSRQIKWIRQSSDLLHIADLEPSFRLDANKCAAEHKLPIVLAVNSATRLIEQLQPLSCKRRVRPNANTLADVMLLEY